MLKLLKIGNLTKNCLNLPGSACGIVTLKETGDEYIPKYSGLSSKMTDSPCVVDPTVKTQAT